MDAMSPGQVFCKAYVTVMRRESDVIWPTWETLPAVQQQALEAKARSFSAHRIRQALIQQSWRRRLGLDGPYQHN